MHYLLYREHLAAPSITTVHDLMINHMKNLYDFYGETRGVFIARKHVSWYSKGQRHGAAFRQAFNNVDTAKDQLSITQDFFESLMVSLQ